MKTLMIRLGLAVLFTAGAVMPANAAVAIDWVTVGDPGNVNNTTPFGAVLGAVSDSYRIMKYEWTNSQYVEFLNGVDPEGTNPNEIYSWIMAVHPCGGITNTGTMNGSRYSVRTNMGDKPVNYVTWWDSARVANWLHNGAQMYSTSDSSINAPQNIGAYTLGTLTSGTAPEVNAHAKFYVPTEDQWYKAAYYKGEGTNTGYWLFATQSDSDR